MPRLDLSQSPRVLLVVFLDLLQVSSLLEQGLTRSSALVLQDLLLLQVCSLRSLHELVSVVLVPHLQVVEGVQQGFDFLFALSDLPVQFISVSLEFFLFLSRLDDIVSLGVLSDCFHFTATGLGLLDKALILDAQILHLILSELQLDGDLVSLLL